MCFQLAGAVVEVEVEVVADEVAKVAVMEAEIIEALLQEGPTTELLLLVSCRLNFHSQYYKVIMASIMFV